MLGASWNGSLTKLNHTERFGYFVNSTKNKLQIVLRIFFFICSVHDSYFFNSMSICQFDYE